MPICDFPPIELICQALEDRDGVLYWKIRPREHLISDGYWRCVNSHYAGKIAGCMRFNGHHYRHGISVFKRRYYRHTLVWAIHTGEWRLNLDHKDRDSTNDKISNLRVATLSQNHCNSKINKNNTSGFKGVSWDKSMRKWYARIVINRKVIFLGFFDDPAEAHAVRMKAARELHGEFASDGKPPS